MPAIPPPTIRAPPSSQPVLPTRNKSAFPSLQRPRPGQPPSFGRPSSTQARQSQSQTPWRDSQAPSQSQSQRPTPNRLDNRYSPPSSQPTQLFPSQSQTQRQVSRPLSSLGGSQHAMGIIDHYRPDSIPMPRTAAQVYQGDRPSSIPPKAQKGVEILEKIAGLYSMIEEKFGKKEEEDTEFQEALEDRLKGLEDENKDLKERLHELSMGQKVLPTKSELNEEIGSQLTPALNEFLESISETIKNTITPLPESTAELAAGRVRIHMLEMQDLARKEAVREGAVETPLMTLLNHLITKLSPLDDITSTLSSLSGLPEALEQVAVFRETMKTMQDRISNRTEPQAQAHAAQLPSMDVNQISKLQETMEEIMRKVGTPSEPTATVGLDSGKVFSAITGLKRALEEVKVSVGTGSENGEMKEMRDLMLEMKTEMAGMKDTLANLTQSVPTPAIDRETSNNLRAILEQLAQRPVPQVVTDTPAPPIGQAHTPTTGIRPASDVPQPPESEDVASPLRIFDRPIRPTPWARQDPAAMRVIANRIVQSDPAGGEESDIFGTIQPIPSDPTATTKKKQKTKPPSTLKFTLPIPKDFQGQSQGSQSTSSRNSSTGSVTNKMKRKTPPNSLSLRPTTRSCSSRGKEIGIDVIDLESSESNGKKRGRVVPETSNSGDTIWPLGLPDSVRPEIRPRLGGHDQPIEIETPPLPESQDLDHSQSQTQPQTQTQLNNSQIESTFEFGHGQLPSIPSLPGYESTQHETQVDTPTQPEKEVTSTELVEQSLALPPPPPPPRRAEPGYRKYQGPRTYGGSTKMHGFLKGNFMLLLDSDDEG